MKIRSLFILLLVQLNAFAQKSWYPIPGAPAETRIEDISFISDSTGFLEANDTIYKTVDAGSTWTVSGTFFPGYVRSIEFINDTLGFIGTLLQAPTAAGIYRTQDGGQTWASLQSLLPNPPAWGICGIAHYHQSIVAVGSVMTESNVYYSHDAGNTWSQVNLSAFANALIDVFMLDSLTWLVSGKSNTASFQKATILRTDDGGQTWTRVALAGNGNTYCWKIFMQNNGTGYGSIEDFTGVSFFRTLDNGLTWQESILNGFLQSDVGATAVWNDTTVWLGVQHNSGYFESHDAGLNWTYSNAGLNMNRMVIPDGITPLCVGATVYRYGTTTGWSFPVPAGDAHHLEIFPTPASGTFSIRINLSVATPLYIIITDLQGRLIKLLDHSSHPAGPVQFDVSVEGWENGSYVVQVISNQQNFGRRFQVMK